MSKLEELIEELCPDGVEYKSLVDICGVITTGKLNANAMVEDGKYPFFTCDANPFRIDEYAFDTEAILISGNGSQVGHINYYKGKFNAYQRTYVTYNFNYVDVKYLLHYLNGNLRPYIMIKCKKGSVPYITLPMLQNFMVPIPPLPVQEEIVRILDNFTDLTAELQAELQAREKQYEYYRHHLFDNANNASEITLDMISENCDNQRKPITSGQREAGEYPYYGASGIVDYVKDYIYDGDYLLVSEDGVNLVARNTPIAFSISGKNWVNNHAHVLKFDNYYTRRYVEMYLNSIDLTPFISGAAQPKLNQKNLNKIPIPLPSMDEQKKIVDMLDRFDTLCSDISIGLPAEIEARQKQYEYYRNKLLTFKELGA